MQFSCLAIINTCLHYFLGLLNNNLNYRSFSFETKLSGFYLLYFFVYIIFGISPKSIIFFKSTFRYSQNFSLKILLHNFNYVPQGHTLYQLTLKFASGNRVNKTCTKIQKYSFEYQVDIRYRINS